MIKDPSIENESEVENENPKMAQLCSVLLKTKTINVDAAGKFIPSKNVDY